MFWQCSESITYELKVEGGRLQGCHLAEFVEDDLLFETACRGIMKSGRVLGVLSQDHVRAEGTRF